MNCLAAEAMYFDNEPVAHIVDYYERMRLERFALDRERQRLIINRQRRPFFT